MKPTPNRLALLMVWAALVVTPIMGCRPLAAQTIEGVTATPDEAATLFLRSVRAIRWSTAAQFMHAETLDRFHLVVTMIADADSTGDLRSYLTETDSTEYHQLAPAEVFDRAIGKMIDNMPGLMHSIFDRDDEVLGHVMESGDTAHVVYRTTARISGAVSEVKVMQLVRTAHGWRVFWSDEMEVLDAALRGVARSRAGPPRG